MSDTHGKTLPRHPYHLVDVSPWPFFASMALLLTTVGGVMYMHSYAYGDYFLTLGIVSVLYSMYVWWADIVREATYEGHHTRVVQQGLTYGMVLFIVSECMFFFAIFWGFFASSLSPTIELGSVWPPAGILPFNPWEIPAVNTGILLLSGASITWAHHAIIAGNREQSLYGFIMTLILAVAFTALQGMEYNEAPFAMNDGVYGSTFYMATGFHGLHVIIGTIFIAVCFIRQLNYHFTREHHFGFEAAAWYWHFVDVVWLFLFVAVYWWGGA